MSILSQKANLLAKARQGSGLKVLNFTPSTGIGKFDARFDPFAKELHITLKVFYKWASRDKPPKPWTAAETTEFRTQFKQVVEDTWTDRYTIASSKDDFRDLYARVFVHVEEVPSKSASHYSIEVTNIAKGETSGAGIDRANLEGKFGKWDVYLEEKEARDKAALEFKMRQVADKLASSGAQYIPFPNDSSKLPMQSAAVLNSFASGVNSIITKEMADSEFRLYVYAKTGKSELAIKNVNTAKNRAKAVADFLRQKLMNGQCVTIVESSRKEPWIVQPVGDIMRKNRSSPQEIQSRAFPGAMVLVKDPGAMGMSLTSGMKRNYVIVAHECGHMFGLPDEYFGVNCLSMQQQIDLRSIVPDALRNLTRLKANPREPGQSEGFAALLAASNVPAPVMMDTTKTVTTSIMYAGSEVLPAHYLTFWEALLNVTFPFLHPSDWKIVPNAAGVGKKSDLAHFAV